MALSPLAGKPAPKEMLVDLARLEREYFERRPDPDDPAQLVSFGTSGHRGTSAARLVHRGAHPGDHAGHLRLPASAGDHRPALHGQGHARALRAGAAHRARGAGGQRRADHHPARRRLHADAGHLARHPRPQPRPQRRLADGIVITPSHNPPEDGGFKYNPPNGGPADTDVTRWIEDRANELLRDGNAGGEAAAAAPPRISGRHDAPATTSCSPTSTICATSSTWTRSAPPGSKLGRRSARRRRRALLGADQRDLRPRHHRRQPAGRSDLLVHDRRSRRQDPHGLLEPLRDGPARRPQGSLSTSPSPTTPTPIGTASSRRRPG